MITFARWRVRITIARYRNSIVLLLGPVLILGAFVLTVLAARGIFDILVPRAPVFADALLLGAYTAVGGFQVIAGFRWGITRLFLDSDLELLLVAPIPRRRLFAMKLFELVLASPISFALLAAVTWGYGRARGMVLAPLLAIVLPFLLASVAALPGMLIALLISRVMIGPRLRAVAGLTTALLPLAWVLLVGSGTSFYTQVTSNTFDAARLDAMGRTIIGRIANLPTSWPGDVVRAFAVHDWSVVVTDLVLIALAAVVLIAITSIVFFSTFERSWSRLVEGSGRRRTGTLLERLAPPIPRVARGIVVKEWRSFARDLRLVQSLVFPLLIFGFFAIESLRRTGSPPYTFIILIPFLISNQAAVGLLMERRNIGFLMLAPVRGIDVVVGKSIAYAVPTSIVIGAATVAIGAVRHLPAIALVFAALVTVWILVGCMLGGVALAALWGKFDLERPRLGVGPVFAEMGVLISFAATQGGLALWVAGHFVHHNPVAGAILLVLAAATAALVLVLTNLGARRLETFDAP